MKKLMLINEKKSKTSKKEVSIEKRIQQAISANKQRKWVTEDSGIVNSTTTFSFHGLLQNTISQGVTALTRVGTKIRVKKLVIRISWILGDVTQLVRFGIFKWIPSNTSDAASTGEVFDTTTVAAPNYPFLEYSPSRFKILFDKTFALDTYHPTKFLEIEMPLNVLSEFDTGVNTGRNHLYYFHGSDSGAVPHPTIDVNSKVVWEDQD